jgi:hypothetical protein
MAQPVPEAGEVVREILEAAGDGSDQAVGLRRMKRLGASA